MKEITIIYILAWEIFVTFIFIFEGLKSMIIAAIIQRCQYREYVFVAADRDWVVLGIWGNRTEQQSRQNDDENEGLGYRLGDGNQVKTSAAMAWKGVAVGERLSERSLSASPPRVKPQLGLRTRAINCATRVISPYIWSVMILSWVGPLTYWLRERWANITEFALHFVARRACQVVMLLMIMDAWCCVLLGKCPKSSQA